MKKNHFLNLQKNNMLVLKNKLYASYILLLILSVCLKVNAKNNCSFDQERYQRAYSIYQAQSYLLSAIEFAHLNSSSCTELRDKSVMGYVLSLYALEENDLLFKIIHQDALGLKPVTDKNLSHQGLSEELQIKFILIDKLYLKSVIKNYPSYFSISQNKIAELDQRVEAYVKWENELPQQKSPLTAGTLSALLPGLGQVYTKSYQSAALSFALNALFLSAALELSKNNLKNTALASGLVFSITYVGGVLNAAESARLYNQNYYKDFLVV